MDRIGEMQVFVKVVETGSFSRAAEALLLTQPTITKNIASLESRLKSRLLYRNTRGVSLTESGTLFYERCKVLLADMEQAEQEARGTPRTLAGVLRISASVAFGRRVISPLLLKFMWAHPDLKIELICDDRYADLVAQGLDVAVRMGRLADSAYGAATLGFNPWVAVAAPAYLLGNDVPSCPEDLRSHACLVYSTVQGADVWRFESRGELLSVSISAKLKTNNLSSVLSAACNGLGIALLPHYVAAGALASGQLVRVLGQCTVPGQEMNAVFPSPRLVPAKVTAFVSHIQRHLSGAWWLVEDRLATLS